MDKQPTYKNDVNLLIVLLNVYFIEYLFSMKKTYSYRALDLSVSPQQKHCPSPLPPLSIGIIHYFKVETTFVIFFNFKKSFTGDT